MRPRLDGGRLKVLLPEAPEGVTGRIVQRIRDGSDWTTVSVSAGRAVLTRAVAAGHRYSAAYQDVTAFKPDSDDVRDSPALDVAVQLNGRGAHVIATDPEAIPAADRRGEAVKWG